MSCFDKPVPSLTDEEQLALYRWGLADFGQLMNSLEAAGLDRNIMRFAHAYGPAMIAMMVQYGKLAPGEDPLDALLDLM